MIKEHFKVTLEDVQLGDFTGRFLHPVMWVSGSLYIELDVTLTPKEIDFGTYRDQELDYDDPKFETLKTTLFLIDQEGEDIKEVYDYEPTKDEEKLIKKALVEKLYEM